MLNDLTSSKGRPKGKQGRQSLNNSTDNFNNTLQSKDNPFAPRSKEPAKQSFGM